MRHPEGTKISPAAKQRRREYESRYHKENPGMATHRQLARRAFPVRQKCQVKGCNELGERHHEDWRKPLEIIWLCQKHHVQWDNSYQTYGEIDEYGRFTLEEFLEGKSIEQWRDEKRARSSVEEQCPDKAKVVGSSPTEPTMRGRRIGILKMAAILWNLD